MLQSKNPSDSVAALIPENGKWGVGIKARCSQRTEEINFSKRLLEQFHPKRMRESNFQEKNQ
jgi:hypothetical protein